MKGKFGLQLSVLAAAAVVLTTAAGARGDGPMDGYRLYGVRGATGDLVRYDFAHSRYAHVGAIRTAAGDLLTGVEATGYMPRNMNLFGFWFDESQGHSRLVYLNSGNARAAFVGEPVGPGPVTGATVCSSTGGAAPAFGADEMTPLEVVHAQRLFAVQSLSGDGADEPGSGGMVIGGRININPNKSPGNQFVLTKPDGSTITRDDLHSKTRVSRRGVMYSGPATQVRVKPKGNGNQNGMTVNGQPYTMSNGTTCVIDSEHMTVSLYNSKVSKKGRALGQWWISIDATGATMAQNNDVPFNITGGAVVPTEAFAARVSVLGAAITSGSYDMPVTTNFAIDGQTFMPFGDSGNAVTGNVNDDNNPRHHVFPTTFSAGTPITVYGKSWLKKKNWYSGSKRWHWKGHMAADSAAATPQVKVLRHGDPVPDIQPFENQSSIVSFVGDYIDTTTNTIVLKDTQAIFLFELGTTDLGSSAADFQDLTVLVTLATNPADFEDPGDPPPAPTPTGATARLIEVDTTDGSVTELMTLDRAYDGLAGDGTGRFCATSGRELWVLDPTAGTEVLLGSMGHDEVKGLEFAGSALHGFAVVDDRLVPINAASGATMGDAVNIQATDLTSIVFMRRADAPTHKAMD